MRALKPHFHDLGECEVKHGVRVTVGLESFAVQTPFW